MKRVACFLLLAFLFVNTFAQTKAEYLRPIKIIRANIDKIFYDKQTGYYKEFNHRDTGDKKAYSYLWPLCGLIQAANESDAIGTSKDLTKKVLAQLQPYYDTTPPAPGYNSYLLPEGKEERFYDDNQWIGIACIDAYERTKDEAFLRTAKEIYRFMMTGYDTVSGGGLYWKEGNHTTKNTCSNGPGALLALKLYVATQEKNYFDTALLLFNWVNKTLSSPDGLYYDHLQLPSKKIDKRVYTYNAGTMVESAVLLYEITRDKNYLDKAMAIAEAAYKTFFKNGRWPPNYWFNVVLLRGYEALLRQVPDKKYMQAFAQDAQAIWQFERDAQNLVGPHSKKSLLEQAASLELFARLYQMNKK